MQSNPLHEIMREQEMAENVRSIKAHCLRLYDEGLLSMRDFYKIKSILSDSAVAYHINVPAVFGLLSKEGE